jgi:hypothetical protein
MSTDDLTAKLRVVAARCSSWRELPRDQWTSRGGHRQSIEVQLRNLSTDVTLFVVPKHPEINFAPDDGVLRRAWIALGSRDSGDLGVLDVRGVALGEV